MATHAFSQPWLVLCPLLVLAGADASKRPTPRPAQPHEWVYRTEQHWLAAEGATAVAELASSAAGARAPSVMAAPVDQPDRRAAPTRFALTLDGAATDLVLTLSADQSVWSPATYASLASRLSGRPAAPDAAAIATPVLTGLTDLRATALESANQAISTALRAHPGAPALHDAAALLLGAFAMREEAGAFSDARAVLTRIAAHLAVADARRSSGAPVGHEGRLARAVLAMLAGRQADAIQIADGLEADATLAEGYRPWLRAVRVRTTLDWRLLAEPHAATLMERLAHARALQARLDNDAAGEFVEAMDDDGIADWGRLILSGQFSVQDGNAHALVGVDRELREMAAIYQQVHGQPFAPHRVAAALRRAGRADTSTRRLDVIAWPMWADFFERHLADQILKGSVHLEMKLGLRDRALDWRRATDRAFSELRWYPLVRALRVRTGAELEAELHGLMPFWRHPESVPPAVWTTLRTNRIEWCPWTDLADEAAWFAPTAPDGTVPEDIWIRLRAKLGTPRPVRLAELETWRRLAPWKRALAVEDVTQRYGQAVTAADVAREYAPFLAMDVPALHGLASAEADPRVREQAYRDLCGLMADECGYLAWHLIDLRRDDEAAVVFRRWMRDTRDRVFASGKVFWLIDYELDHGRPAAALALAKDAYSTGSRGGIAALSQVLERVGRLEEAETVLLDARDRYPMGTLLLAFYLRNAHQSELPQFATRAEQWMQDVFPDGMVRDLRAADFAGRTGPPDGGVVITSPTARLLRAGIRAGDVIVAVDGVRVRTQGQFGVVSGLSRQERLRFVSWRGDRYVDVEGVFPGRHVAEGTKTYGSAE